jgi:cbb3-type cytochrome oxidase subunit 3
MNLMKDFFFFTKLKLVTFVLGAAAFLYIIGEQNKVLGNATILGLVSGLILIYLLLCIAWFSFRDKKHFLIGLVVFILLIGGVWCYSAYSTQRRAEAYEGCLKENNLTSLNGDVMQCMALKGYRYYR